MNFETDYKNAVNQHKVSNKLVFDTNILMNKRKTKRSSRIKWGVVIPVCSFAFFCSMTVFAYSVSGGFANSVYKPKITDDLPEKVTSQAGCQVDKTINKSGLSITVKNTISDSGVLYISFEVESVDGSPLQELSQYRKSILARQGFGNSKLKIDDREFDCVIFRTDKCLDPSQSKASFEGQIHGDITNSESAKLIVNNFTDFVICAEDAEFLFDNLGDMSKNMTFESSDNFIKTGTYIKYADESIEALSWTIPAGKNRVAFSKQFPKSYIDNIGFHKTGEYGCERDVFYISITPGSEEEATRLKKLAFQNTSTLSFVEFEDSFITGNEEKDKKLAFNGGRIIIALDLFLDSGDLRDCTGEDLYSYKLVKNLKQEEIVRFSGEWEVPFQLDFTDTTKKYTINKNIQTDSNILMIKDISVSDLSYCITGVLEEGSIKSIGNIELILSDGSVVSVGNKVSQSAEADGKYKQEGLLENPLDSEEVVAVKIMGERVDLKTKTPKK